MARRYVNVRAREMPAVIASALFQGEWAKDAAEIADVTKERVLLFIQGLSFLILGTICQAPIIIREFF